MRVDAICVALVFTASAILFAACALGLIVLETFKVIARKLIGFGAITRAAREAGADHSPERSEVAFR